MELDQGIEAWYGECASDWTQWPSQRVEQAASTNIDQFSIAESNQSRVRYDC